jgi:hypothetical protein
LKAVSLAIAFMLIGNVAAFARAVLIPTPDQLAAPATVICNGVVESVTQTSVENTGTHPWDSVTHFTAKIKSSTSLREKFRRNLKSNIHRDLQCPTARFKSASKTTSAIASF